MSKPLPQDTYLFAKFDKDLRYVYLNQHYRDLLKYREAEFMGHTIFDIRQPMQPLSIYDFIISNVNTRGFGTALLNLPVQSEIYWTFVEMSKRYGSDDQVGEIGYEAVFYPASQHNIDFFEPLYEQLIKLENEDPEHMQSAKDYFVNYISDTGKPYDELVHTLQNS